MAPIYDWIDGEAVLVPDEEVARRDAEWMKEYGDTLDEISADEALEIMLGVSE